MLSPHMAEQLAALRPVTLTRADIGSGQVEPGQIEFRSWTGLVRADRARADRVRADRAQVHLVR